MSSMRVPRPGPSSTSRTRLGLPAAKYRVISHIATSYFKPSVEVMKVAGKQTSPKTWEISGEVMKSPLRPKTSPLE